MPLTEYDCTSSTAIQRIALNKLKNELIVIYEGGKDVYLYYDLPADIEVDLISRGSKGGLVNKIKKISNFRKISSFPKDVKMYRYPTNSGNSNSNNRASNDTTQQPQQKSQEKKKKQEHKNYKETKKSTSPRNNTTANPKPTNGKKKYKNYSKIWLDVLAKNTDDSLDYLQSLLPLLDEMIPHFPPGKKPHRMRKYEDDATPDVMNDLSGVTNMFNDLLIEDDSSIDSANENDRYTEKKTLSGDGGNITVQVRYLRVRVLCSIAETFRNRAMCALREKNYVDVRLMWQLAWNTLISCQENIDEWWALLCHLSDDPSNISPSLPKLPKKHDRVQLVELFHALHLLIEDTERQREHSLAQLTRKLENINRKLHPMITDRNTVKASMGEEKWTNNPEPQQTYAMRRKQWEEEQKLLLAAMEVVQGLDFNLIYDGRG